MKKFLNLTTSKLFFMALAIAAISCGKGPSTEDTTATTTTPATLSVQSNQVIAGFPHTIDYYIPSNAESAVIFLHGGGGKKEGVAYSLGIKNDNTTANYNVSVSGNDWLINNKVMAVFPQGQHLAGKPLAATWNNYMMDSGQDDVAFLQSLVAAIQADSSLPHITKFYLVGHSNGGMMVNRMWCESPNTFSAYGALSGPPSTMLDAAGAHPCNPVTAKPYIGIVGDTDTGLQTTGNMGAATWLLRSYDGTSPVWVNSTVINDLLYLNTRATKKCGGASSGPSISGQLSTYTGCSNTLKEIIVSQAIVGGQPSGGDHCLLEINGDCVTTLTGASGLDYKTAVFDFLKSF